MEIGMLELQEGINLLLHAVSYDSRFERPGVADCDLNTRDRNRGFRKTALASLSAQFRHGGQLEY
jgi:hypothetical protein